MVEIREEHYNREFADEIEELQHLHAREVDQLRFPTKINHIAYIMASNRGQLATIAVRDEGKLVGYIGFIVGEDWNTEAYVAKEAGMYLKKEYRKGRTAIKMIKFSEKVLKEKGVDAVLMMSSAEKKVGPLYEYLKYREVETSYIKEL